MLRIVYQYLTYMETWHVLVGLALMVGMICLLWTKRGLSIYIALFFVAETFATAGAFRATVPFLALLPMFLALPLLISMTVRKDRLLLGGLSWAWIVVMVYFGIRSNFSKVGTSASFWAIYHLVLMSMGLMVGALIASPSYRMSILRWLVYGGVVTMLLGMSAIFVSGWVAYRQGRFAPFGIQANIWGPTSLVAFINCLLYFQLTKAAVRKLAHIAMLAITALSLILSFSRGAIFALSIALIFYWLIGGISRFKGILLGCVLGLMITGFLVYGIGRTDVEIDTSQASRLKEFKSPDRVAWEAHLIRTYVLPNPVFGIGFYRMEYFQTEIKRGDPHNAVLLVLMEQGFIGFLMITALMVISFRAMHGITKVWPKDSDEYKISRFCMFGMVAVFLDGLTVPHLWTHHAMLGVEFAILVGITSALKSVSVNQDYDYVAEYSDDMYLEPIFHDTGT